MSWCWKMLILMIEVIMTRSCNIWRLSLTQPQKIAYKGRLSKSIQADNQSIPLPMLDSNLLKTDLTHFLVNISFTAFVLAFHRIG